MVFALILTILIPLITPFVALLLQRFKAVDKILKPTIALAVTALIFFHLLPEMWPTTGWWGMFALLVGFISIFFLECNVHKVDELSFFFKILIYIGALLHVFMDGAALHGSQHLEMISSSFHEHHLGEALGWSVFLHRIPACLMIWIYLKKSHSPRYAYFILASVSVVTLLGYWLYSYALSMSVFQLAPYLMLFAAGSILHVIADSLKFTSSFIGKALHKWMGHDGCNH